VAYAVEFEAVVSVVGECRDPSLADNAADQNVGRAEGDGESLPSHGYGTVGGHDLGHPVIGDRDHGNVVGRTVTDGEIPVWIIPSDDTHLAGGLNVRKQGRGTVEDVVTIEPVRLGGCVILVIIVGGLTHQIHHEIETHSFAVV